MGEAGGRYPLLPLLRACVLPPLQPALPIGVWRCAAQPETERSPIDDSALLVAQFARLHREAQGPALGRVEVEAVCMGQTRLVRFLEVLAFVEDVDLIGQPPPLAERPAVEAVGVQQGVMLGRIG
ncbi:hypothetical protein D3C73_809970 [compost metagenome]